jgi:hypothetical protein
MKKTIIITLFLFSSHTCFLFSQNLVTGFRASRVLNSYPNKIFPNADYWISTGKTISGKFNNSSPAGVWIVSLYWDSGMIGMDFPSPVGNVPYITFLSTDYSEPYLSRFDQAGIKIWLQVEPGAASIDTLISLVLNRYKNHPCVAGFGIDIEWYNAQSSSGGQKVTDAEAERWEKKVLSIDPNYTLFLKHYSYKWMPPTYRGRIIFIDDSQDFNSSSNPFNYMLSEFKSWGSKFYPNPVAFQFGYSIDSTWWRTLNDPFKTIGTNLIASIPNTYGLFWVDFTITKLFPLSVKRTSYNGTPSNLELEQNYPNPFNPVTSIPFSVTKPGFITLKIYNELGMEVETLLNKYLTEGSYTANLDASKLTSGVYYYRLSNSAENKTRTMILEK